MVIATLINGGLLTLGITCIFLSSPKDIKAVKQQRLWRTYIIMLCLGNLGYQAAYFLWITAWIIYDPQSKKRMESRSVLSTVCNLFPAFIAMMTDGVLVSDQIF